MKLLVPCAAIFWLLPQGLAAPVLEPRAATPPGGSGPLTGPSSLLGSDGNPVDFSEKAVVSDYQEVPGQDADADLGFYFDFTKSDNPAFIRGSKGAPDPGPSK